MKLRSILKKVFISSGCITRYLSDATYVKILYWLEFKRFPNLEAPKTFNEWICKRKISAQMQNNSVYTDKYAVKEYVEAKLGKDCLIPMLGVYKSFADIDFSALPEQFALKSTHSSGQNVIVTNRETFNAKLAEKKFSRWLKTNYYWIGREKNYATITPQIIAEKYIDLSRFTEYKFFCFYGEIKFATVNRMENGKRYTSVYDANWQPIAVKFGYELSNYGIEDAEAFSGLCAAARSLSADFDFVRVDLYFDGKQILFSELTFNPGSGIVRFEPNEFDSVFGAYFIEK